MEHNERRKLGRLRAMAIQLQFNPAKSIDAPTPDDPKTTASHPNPSMFMFTNENKYLDADDDDAEEAKTDPDYSGAKAVSISRCNYNTRSGRNAASAKGEICNCRSVCHPNTCKNALLHVALMQRIGLFSIVQLFLCMSFILSVSKSAIFFSKIHQLSRSSKNALQFQTV